MIFESSLESLRVKLLRRAPQVLQTLGTLHGCPAWACAVAFVAIGAAFGVAGAIAEITVVYLSGKERVKFISRYKEGNEVGILVVGELW